MRSVLVSVENVPAEGKTFALEYAMGDLGSFLAASDLPDVEPTGGVSAEIRLLPSGRDLFVFGTLQGRVAYECVRCLEKFERDVAGEFHWVGVTERGDEGGEFELDRQDLDMEVLESGSLNLTRLVEEQLLLALEPHPVCTEACRGLCPQCGGNRDRSECRCAPSAGDPRFAVLAALRSPGKPAT